MGPISYAVVGLMIQNGEKQRELAFLCIKMAMKATIFFLGSSSSEIMMHMGFWLCCFGKFVSVLGKWCVCVCVSVCVCVLCNRCLNRSLPLPHPTYCLLTTRGHVKVYIHLTHHTGKIWGGSSGVSVTALLQLSCWRCFDTALDRVTHFRKYTAGDC